MRLVDGFLEEEPEERAKRQRTQPTEEKGLALERSAAAEASIMSEEPGAAGSEVSTRHTRPDDARVGRAAGEGSPRDMPGRTAWMESRTERARLAQLARRRLWSWIIVLGVLFAVFLALIIVVQVAHVYMPPLVRTIEFAVTGALLASAILVVCAITIEKSTFQRHVDWFFDPIAQDRAIWTSLEFGDPRGDGRTGAYVTRPDLRRELERLAFRVDAGPGGRRRVRRLLGTRHLPAECRDSSVLSAATETALRRWWDLGLLDAAAVVDRGAVRLVFSGIVVQGP